MCFSHKIVGKITNIFRSTYTLYNVKIFLRHEASDRNEYQGYLLGVNAAGA